MWIKHRKYIIKATQCVRFLKVCINKNIIPTHLKYLYKQNTNLTHYRSLYRYERLNNLHSNRILRLELNDAFRNLHHSRLMIFRLVKQITYCIPINITNTFFNSQEKTLYYFTLNERQHMDTKIRWLLKEKIKDSAQTIRTIKYYCQTADNSNNQITQQQEKQLFSLTPSIQKDRLPTIEVKLDPHDFQDTSNSSSIDSINKKWFLNLSHTTIPQDVQRLLQLGHNFSLPSNDSNNNTIQLIKNIENNLIKFHEDVQFEVRNRVLPFLHNIKHKARHKDTKDIQILELLQKTKKFVKNNPNVIFTRADKGNVTVALDKNDYYIKIEEILKDTETYTIISKDPTNRLTKDIREILTSWKNRGYIENNIYHRVFCSDGNLPRAYGLPKIHKPGLTFRIIISCLDSPTYAIADYLQRLISKNVPKPSSHIENSYQLIKKLKGINIVEGHELISLDVVSMFTNIPLNLVIESISNRWAHIGKGTKIPKNEFIKALKLILESTYFKFNNIIYKQNFGTPMGSPLSPIVSELVLQDLEMKALKTLNIEIPLYFRYVDDVALAAPRQNIEEILKTFNSIHNRLQFTLERGINKLNFLDVSIENIDGLLEFDWYKKPTFSGRTLHFLSQHPITHKRGVLMNMIDRAILLSNPKYHEKNLKFVIEMFIKNDYPLQFIFDTMRLRLKSIFNKRTKKQADKCSNNENKKGWFLIPFIKNVSEKFKTIAHGLNMTLSFFSFNKLGRIIKVQKDKLALECNKNVVYKLACKNCDSTYVGQTKRKLKTRLTEHKNDIKRKTGKFSVITEHRLENNHEFDWDNPKILDKEKFYFKRLLSEMISIKSQKKALNLQSDTELLPTTYVEILNKF